MSKIVNTEICNDEIKVCEVFPLAKQKRMPFQKSTTMTSHVFELIHIDLWGPYHVFSQSGARYVLTLVDDFNKMTWTYLMADKTQTSSMIALLLNLISNQFNRLVKVVRSKNGLEFINRVCHQLFTSKGIIH